MLPFDMENPKVLILATSLDADSRSRVTARYAEELFRKRGTAVRFADLREFSLPLCGEEGCYENEDSKKLRGEIEWATHVLFAVPVYNYDVNAAAKNVVELMGRALTEKTVAFICAAGGHRSYMSVMGFANSLMLDFRCWIVPRFVYVTGRDVEGESIANPEIVARVEDLVEEMYRR